MTTPFWVGLVAAAVVALVVDVLARWRHSFSRAAAVLYHDYSVGRVDPQRLESLFDRARAATLSHHCVNQLVCIDIAAGRYAEALRWRAHLVDAAAHPEMELLIRVNEAEALACLGRLGEALAWVDRDSSWEWLRAGSAGCRAWVLSLLGEVAQARAALAGTSAGQLPVPYRAEWHLSEAAVAMAAGEWSAAEGALNEAQALAVRESTRRNVHFMRGQVRLKEGRVAEALEAFSEGERSVYPWQGGDARLAWGDALMAAGRSEEARAVWARCIECDPQSPAAAMARERLRNR